MSICIFTIQVIKIAHDQYQWYSLCAPLPLQRGLHLNLVIIILLLFFISLNNVSLVLSTFVHFIQMESYYKYIYTYISLGDLLLHFVICLRFIHVNEYNCDSVTLTSEFHCMNKSRFISLSSFDVRTVYRFLL